MPPNIHGKYRNEEVRGLFVIGVIAILVILHYDSSIRNSSDPNWQLAATLIDILLVFWVGYTILAVVGFSEDIFGKRISQASYLIGLYALGVAVVYCLSFILLFATNYFADLLYQLYQALFPCPPGQTLQQSLNCQLGGIGFSLAVLIPSFALAFYGPPILVAWGMSRTYGKKIWVACGFTIVLNVVSEYWYFFAKETLALAVLAIVVALVSFIVYVKRVRKDKRYFVAS